MAEKIEDVINYLMVEGVSYEKIVKQTGAKIDEMHDVATKYGHRKYLMRTLALGRTVNLVEGTKRVEVAERDKMLVEMRNSGMTYHGIMLATGVTKNTITRAVGRAGTLRERKNPAKDWEKIAINLSKTMSIVRIVKIVNVSQKKVAKLFQDNNIEYRNSYNKNLKRHG